MRRTIAVPPLVHPRISPPNPRVQRRWYGVGVGMVRRMRARCAPRRGARDIAASRSKKAALRLGGGGGIFALDLGGRAGGPPHSAFGVGGGIFARDREDPAPTVGANAAIVMIGIAGRICSDAARHGAATGPSAPGGAAGPAGAAGAGRAARGGGGTAARAAPAPTRG